MILMIDVYYLGIAVLLIWTGLFLTGLRQYSKESFAKSLALEARISSAIKTKEDHVDQKQHRQNLKYILETNSSSDWSSD